MIVKYLQLQAMQSSEGLLAKRCGSEGLLSLPVELVSIIIHYVPIEVRHKLRLVCKCWSALAGPPLLRYEQLVGLQVLGIIAKEVQGSLNVMAEDELFLSPRKEIEDWDESGPLYDHRSLELCLVCHDTPGFGAESRSVLGPLKLIVFISDNTTRSYTYMSNWRFKCISGRYLKGLGPSFKYIGEEISRVEVSEPNYLQANDVTCDSIKIQPEGKYSIILHMKTKRIGLGVDDHDCYYPVTIWDEL